MSKLNFWPFGGKPQMTNPNDVIVKTAVLLIKETILGYPYIGNNFQSNSQNYTLQETVNFKVGTYNTYANGNIFPNYENGFLELSCKTIEEAETAYDFLVKNKGKLKNVETLKEIVLSTK